MRMLDADRWLNELESQTGDEYCPGEIKDYNMMLMNEIRSELSFHEMADMAGNIHAGAQGTVIFADREHEMFYYGKLKKAREEDCRHKALLYCLGICHKTRVNLGRIYDLKSGCIRAKCLTEKWQTKDSEKAVRMAFNLYEGSMPGAFDCGNEKERQNECVKYTAEELFCCRYAPFFWQAVKLRYPEYTEYGAMLSAVSFGQEERKSNEKQEEKKHVQNYCSRKPERRDGQDNNCQQFRDRISQEGEKGLNY